MSKIGTITAACALVGGACLAGTGTAHAQLGKSPLPLRVKAGVLLPSDGDTKDFAGSALYGAEADLSVPLPGAGQSTFTAGYYEGRKGGRTFRVIPLTVSQIFSAPNPASGLTGNVYYGVGTGVYFLRASENGDSENKTTFGGFGVVGYQLPSGAFFIEGKYHVVGSVAGLSPRGLSFTLGRRF